MQSNGGTVTQPDPRRCVAIIGIGCRFPGQTDTPADLWDLLLDGRDAIGQIPADRMAVDRLYDSSAAVPGHIMSRFGGYLTGIDRFDAGFFHISPREAARMDPQQRLVLETSWEAIEDAGIPADQLVARRVGVYVGQWLSDFEMRLLADPDITDFEMTTGTGRYTTAGRVSHFLNLQGPSLTLDTACASSLTAVHLAVQALRSGECEMAFAGGVNLILNPHISIGYSQAQMMAPDGYCKFGDASADGYVRSEGAGMVLLKRLDRALEAGDRIHSIILGSAVNHDGGSSGRFGRPSRIGQQALISAALADSGVSPENVGYVEAHGTGTRTGDREELSALAAILGKDREEDLHVGSVKTNIGHTESAAGVAGLLKTVLAVKHGVIPESLHYSNPTASFDWDANRVKVAATQRPWQDKDRVAGVNGFGIAGSNAHVIIKNLPLDPIAEAGRDLNTRLPILPVSADSEFALRKLALAHADRIERLSDLSLSEYCSAVATRRSGLPARAAFVALDPLQIIADLRKFGAGGDAEISGRATHDPSGVIFVAPGQGGQWTGMARTLLTQEPVFRDTIAECEQALTDLVDWSLTEQLGLDQDGAGWRLDRIEVVQPTLAALAIAYARLWSDFGVTPAGVIGHSMGEVAAAVVSGSLSIPDAMKVVVNRSSLMARTSGEGGMMLVELAGDELERRLVGHVGKVSVAALNSPRSSVVSGDVAAIDALFAELESDGVFCRRINVDVASHGPQMASLTDDLATSLKGISPQTPNLPMYSTVTGGADDTAELDGAYWAKNLREPVRFVDAVGASLVAGPKAFVELGPNPVLLASLAQIQAEDNSIGALVASERRDRSVNEVLAESVAALWVSGAEVDWSSYASPPVGDVPLPLYPFQRDRHWHEAADLRGPSSVEVFRHVSDEARSLLHEIHWVVAGQTDENTDARGQNWLVLGAEDANAPIRSAFETAGASVEIRSLDTPQDAVSGIQTGNLMVVAPKGDAGFVVLEVLQALKAAEFVPDRLIFLTQGATAAGGSQERVSVDQAPLIGAARIVAEEHPELTIRLLDIGPDQTIADCADEVVARAVSDYDEPETALRDGVWHVPRLRKVSDVPAVRSDFALRTDGAYLVTGGLSSLGLRAAKCLAKGGARHIILVSRRPLPPRAEWQQELSETEAGQRIAGVLALEAEGASVEIAAVDVADETAMKAYLAERAAELRPPVRGLLHLATAYDTKLAVETDAASYSRSVTTKLGGAQVLDRLFPELDLFVLYSSTMTFVPHHGLAGYAAANCGLDALAADRRARGQHAISVAWGPWSQIGRAALDHVEDEFEARGELLLDPAQGDELLSDIIARDYHPTLAVLGLDWPLFFDSRQGRAMQLFDDIAPSHITDDVEVSDFATLSASERRKAAEVFVPEAVTRILSLDTRNFDLDRPLGHLGLNSLMGIELRNAFERIVGRPLSATLAWTYPTARALIEYFTDDGSNQSDETTQEPTAEPAKGELSEEIAAAAEMSEAEALAALRGENQ